MSAKLSRRNLIKKSAATAIAGTAAALTATLSHASESSAAAAPAKATIDLVVLSGTTARWPRIGPEFGR